MKKITLAIFALISSATTVFGQANAVIQGPQYDGSWSTLHAPSGSASAVYHRACYLVKQSELTNFSLTNSVVTGFGFEYLNGVSTAVAGQFTVYLENTSDVAYSKGTAFGTATVGMQPSFVGTYNIPVSTGTTSLIMPLTTNFTYTGGGIYVAFEWYSASPASTTPARYLCNTTGLTPSGGSYTFTSTGPAPTTMSLDVFRPAFLFQAANTASNEISVTRLDALGKFPKLMTGGQVVTAQVRNNSNAAVNIPVTLNITGANPFTDTQTLTAVPAGSFATASFLPYNVTTNGLSTMSVTVPADQLTTNNLRVWQQTVTCNDFAFVPPLSATSFTDTQYGLNPSGIYAYEYKPTSNCNLNGVTMIVSSNSAAVGGQLVGVVVDITSGAVIASTNTITITSGMAQTWQTFTFPTPYAMTAATNYYIGVAQLGTATSSYPFTTLTPDYTINNFYRSNPIGSPLTLADRGYLALGAVIGTSLTSLTASATKTIVCKKDGPNTVTLTATSGAQTYTWNPGGSSVNPTIAVTPTVAGTGGGMVFFTVVGTETLSGCKTNSATISVSVSLCTGLADNNSGGYELKLFPNPAVNGKSTITGLSGTNTISVFNTLGQVILTQVVSEEIASLDLSAYPAGNYMVKITNSSSESRLIKVVNQN